MLNRKTKSPYSFSFLKTLALALVPIRKTVAFSGKKVTAFKIDLRVPNPVFTSCIGVDKRGSQMVA